MSIKQEGDKRPEEQSLQGRQGIGMTRREFFAMLGGAGFYFGVSNIAGCGLFNRSEQNPTTTPSGNTASAQGVEGTPATAATVTPTPDGTKVAFQQENTRLKAALAAKPQVVKEETPTATPTPKVTVEVIQGCPPAEQLGPWAPSASGEGETFEFTNHRGYLHMSLWWPHGKTPWGQKEVSVVIEEKGRSFEAINAAGTGWDFPQECPIEEFRKQVEVYRRERPPYTDFQGAVDLEQLLKLGLVRDRLIARQKAGSTPVSTPSPTETTSPTSTSTPTETVKPTQTKVVVVTGTPEAKTQNQPAKMEVQKDPGDREFDTTDGSMVILSWWWPGHDDVDSGKEVRVLIPAGSKVKILGGAGSLWPYPGSNPEAVQKELNESAKKAGFKVLTLDELKKAGLAK